MNFTILELIKNLELNDFKVRSISLDVERKIFKLVLEGGNWFENVSSKPKILEKGGIIIASDYSSFEARYFTPKDKLWHTLDYKMIEMIDEVNEKKYENSELKLAGMSKTSGYWIEYIIKNGKYDIKFDP